MSKLVYKEFSGTSQWLCPAGVTQIYANNNDTSKMFTFTGISSNNDHTITLKSDGTCWLWGFNTSGQLGNLSMTNRSSPVLPIGGHSFVEISAGNIHSLARKADGSVWGWGSNANGRLGAGVNITNRSSPSLVVGSHTFVEISAANAHSLARKSADGSVWAWGNNPSGGLGRNNITSTSSPVLVLGSHSFSEISSRGYNSLARKADGSVWCWGDNTYGNVGDNSIANRSSPVLVVGSHSFVEISNGCTYHSIARKDDGSVWAWGSNSNGQLGDNSITSRSSPVLVLGSHSFIEISTGESYSLARKSDGSAWTWGSNSYGEIGNNSLIQASSPVLVTGGHSFFEISGGGSHSVARKADGSVWSWGYNNVGQIGDLTMNRKSCPVAQEAINYMPTYKTTYSKLSVVPGTTYTFCQIDINAVWFVTINSNNIILGIGNPLVICWEE